MKITYKPCFYTSLQSSTLLNLNLIFVSLVTFLLLASFTAQGQSAEKNGSSLLIKLPAKAEAMGTKPASDLFKEVLKLSQENSFQRLSLNADKSGFSHDKYQQYYKGLPVEYGVYQLHAKNGVAQSISGEQYIIDTINTTPAISEAQALQKALQFVNAGVYKWETEGNAHYPKGELVICKVFLHNQRATGNEMALAYKFDIYADQPLSRAYIYVDAQTGNVIHQNAIIKHAAGTAATRYSGTRTIHTSQDGNTYTLRDFSRGAGIETYNLNKGTNYSTATNFTDTDNNWTTAEHANTQKDNAALDAHWGAMMTYDYFKNVHSRNSFDGNGSAIKNYVHYSTNYINAFWNGTAMTYGDGGIVGNITVEPLTSLDVTAHEIGHAICQHTADLVYSYESGALNEGFSDIWAATVENYVAPEKSIWNIGEELNYTIRSMSNPNQFEQPDTYLGTFWYTGGADNGGVHINSGVLNHWYYILSVGKTGVNDNGDNYTVNGIGIDKAAKIAFRTESVYLQANSQYKDAQRFSVQAAIDLFGAGSEEALQTANAWYAVGLYDTQAAPANLVATAVSGTQINLSWTDNASNETGYSIERSTLAASGFVQIATVGANITSFQNTNLATDAIYYYRVAALTGNIRTAYTNTANASVGNAPIIMSNATVTTCNGIFLDPGALSDYENNQLFVTTFTPATAGNKIQVRFTNFATEAGYDYLRVYDGATTSAPLIGTYSGVSLPPVITATNAAGQLTFRFNSDGVVAAAGWRATITCIDLPQTPSNLVATAVSGTQINLSWTDNASNETGYSIERSTLAASGFVQIATVGANITSFQNTNLATDAIYYYRIRTERNGSYSLFSNTASAIVGILPVVMTSTPVTLCQGSILDPGGSGKYGNGLRITMTLTPEVAGNKLRINFSSFATEPKLDYLSIYNGASTSAPLIGTYSGTTLPPVITATNATGQLTLHFVSDNSVNQNGWIASVSCVDFTPPTISSFTPASAQAGDSIVITGTNFTNASAVKFTNVPAAFTINSATQITAIAPSSTPSGKITVTTSTGTATSTANFTFIIPVFTEIKTHPFTGLQNGTAAWGDYDNDGDLDVVITGSTQNNTPVTKLYRNALGVFTEVNAGLPGMHQGSAVWGDDDNDGDLDLLLTGLLNGNMPDTKIFRNTGGIFTDSNINLPGVFNGTAIWGDYDSDGDTDILLTGLTDATNGITSIYRNTNGNYTDAQAGFTGSSKSAAWGDYDNDGDKDILVAGASIHGQVTKIYTNTNGVFTDSGALTESFMGGTAAWGDYDNDGDLDVLLSGEERVIVYRNANGVFTNIQAILMPGVESKAAWGDYDNDGDLDIVLSGYQTQVSVYKNTAGLFTDSAIRLSVSATGAVVWGDYDNDGDLDLLLTHSNSTRETGIFTRLFRNNSNIFNTAPSAPSTLSASIQNNSVTLSWSKSNDTQTSQNGLTYNIRVGITKGGSEVVSALSATSNGRRRVVELGNAGHNTSYVLSNLPVGTYYWSVQATDHVFAGSAFATEGSFSVKAKPQITLSNLSQTFNNVSGQVTVNTIPAGLPVTITYNGSLSAPVQAGTYTVVATINTPDYYGSVTETMVINKAQAKIMLNNLNQTYNGTAKQVTFTTMPANKQVSILYNGKTELPVQAGIYTVTATIADDNFSGNISASLVINKAQAIIRLSELTHTFDGKIKNVSVTTVPAGLIVTTTYGSSLQAPIQAGTYKVVTTITDENYTATANEMFTIRKADQIIQFDAIADAKYKEEITLSAFSSVQLPVSFTVVSGPAVISGNKVKVNGVGQITVKATQAGNNNYAPATPSEQTFTVAKAAQAITFASLSNVTTAKTSVSLQAYASSGLQVTFSVISGQATVNGKQLTVTGSGDVVVKASQTGNAFYQAAADVEQTITVQSVTKAEQSIVFAALADQTFGSAPVKLSATASSALPVHFTVVSGPALISGNMLVATGAGQVTVRASQDGNDAYYAATSIDYTICIKPAAPVITQKMAESAAFILVSNSKTGNQWLRNGEIIEGATAQQYEVTEAGMYSVIVTVGGCSNNSQEITLTASTNVVEAASIQVYPNPAAEKVFVTMATSSTSKEIIIAVYNTIGLKVTEQVINSSVSRAEFEVSQLAAGTYYLQIKDGKHTTTKTFIKL